MIIEFWNMLGDFGSNLRWCKTHLVEWYDFFGRCIIFIVAAIASSIYIIRHLVSDDKRTLLTFIG
jgi:type II secretory pathway component PulF